jgi:DNA-binding NarL/FixJ family response regulator
MIRILLADDHDLMRQGLRALLEMNANFEVCGEARNGIEAVELAVNLQPNVVILDISMPGMDGLDAAREIRKKVPETQILILTVFDSDEMVRDMLNAGAHGYLLKTDASTHLAIAVEAVSRRDLYFSSGVSSFVIDSLSHSVDGKEAREKIPLSPREIDVLRLLAQGNSNKEIAAALFISVRTVETHRRTIHQKLEVSSVADLVRYAIRHHLVNP